MTVFDWWTVSELMKEEWSFVQMEYGAQYVMTYGTKMML